jgi:N-dimethylarginine dimethylaminohydrolase
LRPINEKAVELSNIALNRFRKNPLVSVVPKVDVSTLDVSVKSEHGRLREVVVSPPTYLDWDCGCPINEKEKANAAKGIMPDRYIAVTEWTVFVQALLRQDVKVIIIEPQPHLLEATYTRDPAVVIDEKLIIGRMHADIRKPETALYANGGIQAPEGFNITLEGGNAVLGKDCVYLGVGDRTTLEGALWLQEVLGTSREVIPLKLKKGVLHLDCVFEPYNTAPSHLLLDRKAFDNDGRFHLADLRNLQYSGWSHLFSFKGISEIAKRFKRQIAIQHSERNRLVPNILKVHPKLAFVHDLPGRIKRRFGYDMNVIHVPSGEVGKGDGSHRCSSMPLVRDDD